MIINFDLGESGNPDITVVDQTLDDVAKYLKEHPEIADEIDDLLRQQMGQMTVPAVDDGEIPEMDPDAGDGDEA